MDDMKTLASRGPSGDPIATPSICSYNEPLNWKSWPLVATLKRSIRSCFEMFKSYSELNQLLLKALSARILMVSSKGTFVKLDVEKLDVEGKLPPYYRRYVDDTFTVMPDLSTAEDFLNTLNHAHPAIKFTMEVEKDGMLPFLGTQLLNRAPRIETKVFVKPTNSGLLLHYHSHVDNRYKRGLLSTMLDRAYRLSSSWSYFTEECDRLKSVFSKLKYPKHLVDSTVKTFLISRVTDQSLLQSKSTTENTIRVVIPFKDQVSANIVKTQLKDLSVKLQVNVQPVFTSRKIAHEFPTNEPKPQLIDQQCVVYNFKCDQCDAGYVGYTRGHLFVRVNGHRSKTSSVRKHYDNRHPGRIPDDLHSCFKVLKKCQNKFDCLVNEMLLIKQLRPCLNVQSDSIRAKVFV